MNRIRQSFLWLLLPFIGVALAGAQTTSVTAPSGSITMGGVAITTGTATFIPVDVNGAPIAVTKSGGGLNLPGSLQAPLGYACSITSGGLGTCNLPDESTSTPSGFRYNLVVCDVSTGNTSSGLCFSINQVQGITGASYALNQYNPSYTVGSAAANTFTSGTGAPSGTCSVPSVYTRTDVSQVYVCSGTAWVQVSIAGPTTASGVVALFSSGGCNGFLKSDGACYAANTIGAQIGGDLGGTLTTPKVVGIQGTSVSAIAPTLGQSLVYNGSQYAPSLQAGNIALPGSPTAVWAGGSAGAVPDLSGNGNNITGISHASVDTTGITFTASEQQVTTPVTGTYQTAMVCFTHNIGPTYITNPTTDMDVIYETNPTFIGTTVSSGSTWLGAYDQQQYRGYSGSTLATIGLGYIYPAVVNPSGGYSSAASGEWIGGPHCLIHVRGSSADTFYMDGVPQSTWYNAGSAGYTMNGNTVLGGLPGSSSNWFWGEFHLVVLWPTQLTAAQATQAESWASNNLQSRNIGAPGQTPPMLTDRISRFAISSMSIGACAGVGPSTCWNTNLNLTNTQLQNNIVRCALGGTTQPFMTARAPYCEDAQMASNASTNVALLWDGINAGGRAGLTPDEQWAEAVKWALDKKRHGIKTIIGTMIDTTQAGEIFGNASTGTGMTGEQYQAAFNSIVYEKWWMYFDALADFSGDTKYGGAEYLGCSGCANNTNYFIGDGTHPGNAGQPIIADIVSNAVNSLTTVPRILPQQASCSAGSYVSGFANNGALICYTLPGSVCGAGYAHSAALTVASSSIVGGADLANYPALVSFNGATGNSITLADLKSVANGGQVQSSYGADITFCSAQSGGTALPFELVAGTYSQTTGAGEFYVKIPDLSASASTPIYVFWDNSSVTSSPENAALTWSDYAAVYHFGSYGGTITADSSGNNNNLTATNSPASIAGEFGGGVQTTAASQTLTNSAPTGLPTGSSQRTVEMWAKISPTVQYAAQFGYGTSTGNGEFVLQSQPDYESTSTFAVEQGVAWNYSIDGNWHFYAATLPPGGSPSTTLLYVDGAAQTSVISGSPTTAWTTTGSSIQINGYPLSIGAGTDGGAFEIDEARISDIQRSAGWEATQYANQSNPSTFFTLGTIN